VSATLAGKVALVTGAASGIGAATARLLAAAGAQVLATDLAEGEGLFALDVRDEAAWERAVSACVARFGRLDILVSNAGTASSCPLIELDLEAFRAEARVHVEGAFLGIRACVAQMRAQRQPATGSIITVGSVAGLKPIMQTAAYGTAKAALLNLTRSVAVELGRKGDRIRANCVLPGGTRTPMTEALWDDAYWADPENFRDVPLRDYCRPEDIAEAILYLADDAAEFVTGSALVVDGGWMIAKGL
jgi:NAD(P)-dependent dehydrogenase (short-subunit alcohol dehydrogenase family)